MAARFEIKKDKRGEFMFNLRAGNHEIILTSESYSAKNGAMNGVESVRKNAVLDERYERKVASNGQSFFALKAGNGEVIGRSEMYSASASMEKGIESIKRNAPVAEISDLTLAD